MSNVSAVRVITSGTAQKHGHAVPDSTGSTRFTRAGCAAPSSTRVTTAQPTSSVGQSPMKQLEADRDEARGLVLALLRLSKQHLDGELTRDAHAVVAAWGVR